MPLWGICNKKTDFIFLSTRPVVASRVQSTVCQTDVNCQSILWNVASRIIVPPFRLIHIIQCPTKSIIHRSTTTTDAGEVRACLGFLV